MTGMSIPHRRVTFCGGRSRERLGRIETIPRPCLGLLSAMLVAGMCLLGGAARANPPVDEIKKGLCLDLKVNGTIMPCNHSLRLVDDGKGEVIFVSGFGDAKVEKQTVFGFTTTQTPDMENAYGYALRVKSVTLMAYDEPDSEAIWPATGLCFMVKPNPVRAGARPVRPDIVVMCSATLSEKKTDVRRLDWKFVF